MTSNENAESSAEACSSSVSCIKCFRSFKTQRGLNQHTRSCRESDLSATPTDLSATPAVADEHEDTQVPIQFIWGDLSLAEVHLNIGNIYEKIVRWRRNLFLLPSGKSGKAYIDECTRLIDEWLNDTTLSSIALKSLMIMPSLLLQKSSKNSKAKDHVECLTRRLALWKKGEFDSLVREVRSIQSKFKGQRKPDTIEELAKKFNRLMLSGKTNAALRLLSDAECKGVLPINDENIKALQNKHPQAADKFDDLLLHGPEEYIGDYAYNSIDGAGIRKIACQIKGAAGPSNLDADGWRRILTSSSFGNHSQNLCDAIARMTKKLCLKRDIGTDGSLESFLSCKLIPLNKNPGVRPIGVGEVLRRIIGRAVITTLKNNIMDTAGCSQLCAGQRSGCEAAVHALHLMFEEEDCDAILLVDADNAFNRINRKVFLHNIRIVCPLIATYVINCYSRNTRLFINGGKEIKSSEGTTQGDPAAMTIYALGTLPFLCAITSYDTRQIAYADDLSCAGKLKNLLKWWKLVESFGPKVGYFPNANKSWIIVKEEKLEMATNIFRGSELNITTEGKKHLGAVIGSEEFRSDYIESKVNDWVKQLTTLAIIATHYPQSAYCAFTAGFCHKFDYFLRTIPNISGHLQPVEDVIKNKLIPALCENRSCNDDERRLLSLPVKLGGLGIVDITTISDIEYQISQNTTSNMTEQILKQNELITSDCFSQDTSTLSSNDLFSKKTHFDDLLQELRENMSDIQRKANDIACSNGSSTWLSTLPLKEHNFSLTKREFIDALYLRYGWQMKNMPTDCICHEKYSVDHAMCCKTGGFISIRHNELVDITADMLSTVCKDVSKEPTLLPTPNNTDDLRADICVRGVWQRLQKAFFDVRVFYPFAKSYLSQPLSSTMKKMEKEKKRKYAERILEAEHGTFTPLIFSSNGGMSLETNKFYNRLGEMLAEKNKCQYSEAITWVRRKICFSLIRTAVICIRGSRSRRHIVPDERPDIDIINKLATI